MKTQTQTQTQTAHTPLPWSIVPSVNGQLCIESDADAMTIAVVETIRTVREKAEQEANAALIFRAVNNHERLEQENAALRAALEKIANSPSAKSLVPACVEMAEAARAALAGIAGPSDAGRKDGAK